MSRVPLRTHRGIARCNAAVEPRPPFQRPGEGRRRAGRPPTFGSSLTVFHFLGSGTPRRSPTVGRGGSGASRPRSQVHIAVSESVYG